jgi:hypothetical protein
MGAIPFLLAFGALPAVATSVYYTIDSTVSSTHFVDTALTGSFYYDPTITNSFFDFTVAWDGINFDLTSGANNPTLGAASTCVGGSTGAAATFAFLTCSTYGGAWFAAEDTVTDLGFVALFGRDTLGGANTATFQAGTSPGPSNIADSGDLITTTTGAVPEPGTYALTLIGLGLVMRKRIATGLRSLHRE